MCAKPISVSPSGDVSAAVKRDPGGCSDRACNSELEMPRLLQIEDVPVSSVTKQGHLAHLLV